MDILITENTASQPPKSKKFPLTEFNSKEQKAHSLLFNIQHLTVPFGDLSVVVEYLYQCNLYNFYKLQEESLKAFWFAYIVKMWDDFYD